MAVSAMIRILDVNIIAGTDLSHVGHQMSLGFAI